MIRTSYKLRYLPLFYEDLEKRISYIATELQNHQAARELIDEVEKAILKRQVNAESFETYRSLRERRYPYYRIYVKSYVIFYVVIDDGSTDKIMEIQRFLYQGQNIDQLI